MRAPCMPPMFPRKPFRHKVKNLREFIKKLCAWPWWQKKRGKLLLSYWLTARCILDAPGCFVLPSTQIKGLALQYREARIRSFRESISSIRHYHLIISYLRKKTCNTQIKKRLVAAFYLVKSSLFHVHALDSRKNLLGGNRHDVHVHVCADGVADGVDQSGGNRVIGRFAYALCAVWP